MGVVKVNTFLSDAVHLSWFPLVTFKEIDNDNASVHTQLTLNLLADISSASPFGSVCQFKTFSRTFLILKPYATHLHTEIMS